MDLRGSEWEARLIGDSIERARANIPLPSFEEIVGVRVKCNQYNVGRVVEKLSDNGREVLVRIDPLLGERAYRMFFTLQQARRLEFLAPAYELHVDAASQLVSSRIDYLILCERSMLEGATPLRCVRTRLQRR